MSHQKRLKESPLKFVKRTYRLIPAVIFLFAFSSQINLNAKENGSKNYSSSKTGWDKVPEILSKIKAPKFPDKIFDITKYGAVPDGKTPATAAIKKEGAVLKFSTDPKDYLPLVLTRFEGVECMNYSPLIYAYGQKNIALTGKGLLDGQADNDHWWPWKGTERFGWKKGMQSQGDEGNRRIA